VTATPDKERRQELLDLVGEEETLLFADGLDAAILGLAHVWTRAGRETVVAYDWDRCIDAFVAEGMTHSDAVEWMEVNVLGGYHGPKTPVYIHSLGFHRADG
jgi:hypothetical protein